MGDGLAFYVRGRGGRSWDAIVPELAGRVVADMEGHPELWEGYSVAVVELHTPERVKAPAPSLPMTQ